MDWGAFVCVEVVPLPVPWTYLPFWVVGMPDMAFDVMPQFPQPGDESTGVGSVAGQFWGEMKTEDGDRRT